ncbi:MAG: Ig-like domain repeat protein [Betaproteobacteria bacterium]|nr:Ig-like domain repeat protein [Betaproteobacteria bacterium]
MLGVDYSGDGSFNTSTSNTLAQTVDKAATTTTITNAATLSGTGSVVGESYAVDVAVAPVAPGAGTPTGSITVGDGAVTCTITLPATSCSLASTSPGTKTITAAFNGDGNFLASTAATASHTVNKANTSTTITNAAGLAGTPTVIGEAYAVNVSVAPVAPGAGTPTGTVSVSDGSIACTITLPATSCSLTSVTTGLKSITATYNADGNFNGSSAAPAAHTVNQPATTTVITNAAALGATPTVVGEGYTVNWSVTVNPPGTLGAPLSGNVTISDGSVSCAAAVGTGTCTLASTSPGARRNR